MLKNLKSQPPKPVCQGDFCQKVSLAREAAPAQQDTQVFIGLLHPSCSPVWSSLAWEQSYFPSRCSD